MAVWMIVSQQTTAPSVAKKKPFAQSVLTTEAWKSAKESAVNYYAMVVSVVWPVEMMFVCVETVTMIAKIVICVQAITGHPVGHRIFDIHMQIVLLIAT